MKIIVGLGNPGKEYAGTRHNVGWSVVEHLSLHLDAGKPAVRKEFHAAVAEARVNGKKALLIQPVTFMNVSGEAVAALKRYFKVALEDLLVIHDEMDFPIGQLSFAPRGGDAGHNGVKSVIDSLGTENFARLRIGIGRPKPPLKKEDYVLTPFNASERSLADLIEEKAVEAAYDWITKGLDKAMNTWNVVKGE